MRETLDILHTHNGPAGDLYPAVQPGKSSGMRPVYCADCTHLMRTEYEAWRCDANSRKRRDWFSHWDFRGQDHRPHLVDADIPAVKNANNDCTDFEAK